MGFYFIPSECRRLLVNSSTESAGMLVSLKNHNVKNNQGKYLGSSCASVIRGYPFDTVIMNIAGLSHKLWRPEEFASNHMVLKISIHETIKNLVDLDISDGEDVAVVFVTFYFMRLCLYSVNTK